MIDRATFDRLVALGRTRGGLTAANLQAALPVEAMDVDALVMLMLELEEAGIGVEPEALGPRAEGVMAGPLLPLHDPGAPRPAGPRRRRPGVRRERTPAIPAVPRVRPDEGVEDEGVSRVVLLAGLVLLVVLGILLVWL